MNKRAFALLSLLAATAVAVWGFASSPSAAYIKRPAGLSVAAGL